MLYANRCYAARSEAFISPLNGMPLCFPFISLASSYLLVCRSAELLNSVPDTLDPDLPGQGWQNSATDSANPRSVTAQNNRRERELEAKELPNYLLAKSFFDCREYDRCASVFLKSTFSQSTPKFTANKAFSETGVTRTARKISQRSFFLALYAMLMAGEKRKAEECGAPLSQQDVGTVKNERLSEISFELEGWFRETQEKSMEDSSDGWLEYLCVPLLHSYGTF